MSNDTPKAWETVLRSIEADLLSGKLCLGENLQPERALAAELGVSRASVREAFRVLEVFGLINTKVGSGPKSGAVIVARPSDGLSMLMRLHVQTQGFEVKDVVEARLILESAVVTSLAEGPPADLSNADVLLSAMRNPELAEAEFLLLDSQFHLSLAHASGNQVIAAMMAGLRGSIEGYVIGGLPLIASWTNTASRLRNEHEAIFKAVQAQDPQSAKNLIQSHIRGYYEELVTNTPG